MICTYEQYRVKNQKLSSLFSPHLSVRTKRKMGCECNNNGVIGRSRILCATLSFLFFLILASTQMRFMAEGRSIPKSGKTVSEDKVVLRGQIGSRPPKCERRCSWCAHCEAIQVPANPQKSSTMKNIAYARDEASNYKPMSWKCKCGSLIFNP
ncbi:EPIDERMAL PATTERNING FACTOR-like protein 2 isoform X1 [Cucurbita pepo subsp. pepo]|uniref:EPIDERMAL PATTERNING FACTOR-like protein 2 isoform X1 n=2 Tax=Cucurbita pepo subsp. pepo TaxID=3664 RepID=UPI000C9D47AF|nr:EPIDERMAL PATTERNING FACTOR-like protein 2 isoform X1 [Cucurbita pepo subsp. pepo]